MGRKKKGEKFNKNRGKIGGEYDGDKYGERKKKQQRRSDWIREIFDKLEEIDRN